MTAKKCTKKDIRTVSTGLAVVPSWLMNVRSSFSFFGGGGGGPGCPPPETPFGVAPVIKKPLYFFFQTNFCFLPGNFNILSILVVKI